MNNTTNAAKRPSGLRACADGFNANPDKEFALKCMRYAADRMEELETELTAVTEQRDRLEEWLKWIAGWNHQLFDENTAMQMRDKAEQALQSLNQPTQ